MFQKRFKKILLFSLIFFSFFISFKSARAQMMGNLDSNITPSANDIKDIQLGQSLYERFQTKQLSCNQLKDDDLEKIGEYIMNQRFKNINQHIQMNNQAKQMMGENGEEQMHIQLGKNITGCYMDKKGGDNTMMDYYGNTMNFGGSNLFSILHLILFTIVVIDLILLGKWLWKQINKK